MEKRSGTLALAGLSIVAAACVCTSALPGDMLGQDEEVVELSEDGEQDESSQTTEEEPSPTVDTRSQLSVELRDEVGGVSMNLPAGWEFETAFGIIAASADPTALAEGSDLDEITAPVIVGLFGSPDELIDGEVTSVDQVTDYMMTNMQSEPDQNQMGAPVDVTIGGYPAQRMSITGRDPEIGIDYEGVVITMLTDQQVGWLIVAAPQDQWADFEPTFDAIVQTIEFFEPTSEAALGDLDLPEEVDEIPTEIRTIAFNETKVETLPDHAAHDWTFEGMAGQIVGMSIAPVDDDFDVEMTVLGPDGEILVEVDDGFSGELEASSLTLPATGRYTLRVTGFAGFGGSYAVSISGN